MGMKIMLYQIVRAPGRDLEYKGQGLRAKAHVEYKIDMQLRVGAPGRVPPVTSHQKIQLKPVVQGLRNLV